MRTCGIYFITNLVNNKSYQGSSVDCEKRWLGHKRELNSNVHGNPHLQNAWNKYGADKFKFEIVEEIPKEQLKLVDQQYLDWIKSMPKHWFYNIVFDAYSGMRGRKASIETRKKLSLCRIGKKLWPNGRNNKLKECCSKAMTKRLKGMNGIRNYAADRNIYTFRNRITDKTFNGTRYDFYTKYNLCRQAIFYVINGKHKHVKNWILEPITKQEETLTFFE